MSPNSTTQVACAARRVRPAIRRVPAQGKTRTVPPVAVCVLLYGDYFALARRVILSVMEKCSRPDYSLIVGANAVGEETLDFLELQKQTGAIDQVIVSETNLNKCPMMRRMFDHVESEFIWWFDDDSCITEPGALTHWLESARKSPSSTVMWGQLASCDSPEDFTYLPNTLRFVRSAPWYRGLPPPSWRPGGKGEFNYRNQGTGDGRWLFITGGCWLIRTSAVRALDWPDPRLVKMGDDVFLGEAIRQQGWQLQNLGAPGVEISAEDRRGELG